MLDTFKLSCVLLWTFSTWSTQRICLLNTCQPKKWAKRYRLMDSAGQTCIPKESMMTPTTRVMTVRETCTQCLVLFNKVFLVCWSHESDELNSKQNMPMCLIVWSRLSTIFSWKFACYLYPLQHDSTLKKTFHCKVFSKYGMVMSNPKKKNQKRDLGKDNWYNFARPNQSFMFPYRLIHFRKSFYLSFSTIF